MVCSTYRQWRPTPLFARTVWSRPLDTPARIYYKYEGVSPAGSHKPNTAVPQAYYNALEGVKKLTTETGAGQWGTALAFACALYGLECEVWQVGASYDSKPYRRLMIEAFGGVVHRSPSELTEAGRMLGRTRPTRRVHWASRSPRRSRSQPRIPISGTRWAGAQPRASAPDSDR